MNFYRILFIASLLVWFGAVISISFLEAPLKFTAPEITVERGLGIGRIVFHALNKVEWFFAICCIVALFYIRRERSFFVLFIIATIILLYQSFILLPQLDNRAEQVLSGNPPKASYHHILYIVLEAIKLLSLLVTAIIFIRKNLKEIK